MEETIRYHSSALNVTIRGDRLPRGQSTLGSRVADFRRNGNHNREVLTNREL
jgi:hypothetical protein